MAKLNKVAVWRTNPAQPTVMAPDQLVAERLDRHHEVADAGQRSEGLLRGVHRELAAPVCQSAPAHTQVSDKCHSLGAGTVEVETVDLMDDEAVDALCAVQLKASAAQQALAC